MISSLDKTVGKHRNQMRVLAVVPLIAFLCVGCENYDRVITTDFVPPGADGKFRFKGVASANEPLNDPAAEQKRERMVAEWLRLNGLCQGGYEIISRSPVLRNRALLGDVYDVFYEGRCKKA